MGIISLVPASGFSNVLKGCGSPVVKVSDHGLPCHEFEPQKTRRVGAQCPLNLSRAQTSSRWCGVVVRRRRCQLSSQLSAYDHIVPFCGFSSPFLESSPHWVNNCDARLSTNRTRPRLNSTTQYFTVVNEGAGSPRVESSSVFILVGPRRRRNPEKAEKTMTAPELAPPTPNFHAPPTGSKPRQI
ncbi:hypothetical protein TNCV_4272501 [Trichonephila clavipes]|nr:hypothetical protein TNCV_4272501 [Trichonephila clavipes]